MAKAGLPNHHYHCTRMHVCTCTHINKERPPTTNHAHLNVGYLHSLKNPRAQTAHAQVKMTLWQSFLEADPQALADAQDKV